MNYAATIAVANGFRCRDIQGIAVWLKTESETIGLTVGFNGCEKNRKGIVRRDVIGKPGRSSLHLFPHLRP